MKTMFNGEVTFSAQSQKLLIYPVEIVGALTVKLTGVIRPRAFTIWPEARYSLMSEHISFIRMPMIRFCKAVELSDIEPGLNLKIGDCL